jgi:hypothetical protein
MYGLMTIKVSHNVLAKKNLDYLWNESLEYDLKTISFNHYLYDPTFLDVEKSGCEHWMRLSL